MLLLISFKIVGIMISIPNQENKYTYILMEKISQPHQPHLL